MQVVFSKAISQEAAKSPKDGCIYLVPLDMGDGHCLNLASVSFEKGAAAFITGGGSIHSIVVQSDPTLDDMLAATFLEKSIQGESLPAGAALFAKYAAVCREGLRPSNLPLEDALEGMFLAIRSDFSSDLSSSDEGARFLQAWKPMADRIFEASRSQIDPFTVALFRDSPKFARQRAYLAQDHEVYRQDVARGQKWIVRLPEGPPEASALLLRNPKSALWKFWSRCDRDSPTGVNYLLLLVERGPGHWIFSTDPVQRLSLKTLADELQQAELAHDAIKATSDPWFDGAAFDYTLVAAPRSGSQLSDRQIMKIAQRWCRARLANTKTGKLPLVAWGLAGVILVSALGFWMAYRNRPMMSQRHDQLNKTTMPNRVAMDLKQGSDLHVLTIGVSKYADSSFDLEVADKDAQVLAEVFRDRPDELYRKVYIRELVNESATRDGILRALGELEQQVTQNDLAIVTFAGHGISDEHQDFFFLPHDFDAQKEIATTAISWDEARRSLVHMPCMVILVMDSCQSGSITRTGFRGNTELEMRTSTAKALRRFSESEKGAVLIAASLASQSAQERNTWGHGALTLALVECLRGSRLVSEPNGVPLPQESDRDGLITLQDVSYYLSMRVKELTHGGQAVITNHTGNLSLDDIPVARGRTEQ